MPPHHYNAGVYINSLVRVLRVPPCQVQAYQGERCLVEGARERDVHRCCFARF